MKLVLFYCDLLSLKLLPCWEKLNDFLCTPDTANYSDYLISIFFFSSMYSQLNWSNIFHNFVLSSSSLSFELLLGYSLSFGLLLGSSLWFWLLLGSSLWIAPLFCSSLWFAPLLWSSLWFSPLLNSYLSFRLLLCSSLSLGLLETEPLATTEGFCYFFPTACCWARIYLNC